MFPRAAWAALLLGCFADVASGDIQLHGGVFSDRAIVSGGLRSLPLYPDLVDRACEAELSPGRKAVGNTNDEERGRRGRPWP